MSALVREALFLVRSRTALAAFAVLAALASVSVAFGLRDVAIQEAAIARIIELQAEDAHAVKQHAGQDAGSAAYYRFHATWDAPSPLAFAAAGQRDVSPTILRVRALALEGQIYESEAGNPELALPGRFDFAFVLIYLAPLVIIALLHDLWSSEREAGRLASLQAMPRAGWRVWGARVVLRSALVAAALIAPFLAGATIRGASLSECVQFAGLTLALVSFWTAVALVVAARGSRSAANAATLAALWFVLTLIAPAGANLAINAVTPIPQGATLVRENREAVHDAWDLDRNATLARFYKTHPEWAHSAPVGIAFDWKWYYAFQQLGDEHVAQMSREYRAGGEERERRARLVSWLLPPIAIQSGLHRLARTDVLAQLAYQDRIRAFHDRLRRFYYPYLFDGTPFTPADFEKAPEFAGATSRREYSKHAR
jgi:ABC-2 type transport system permease protein